ncbi:unnamed protein product [Paramecium primaurelia]|uniref:Uncharacterized protein n=1 Tax=Paramecium primaurelia TaxID=5886 RepID=A0A8S1KB76_PARPR|nr:unnamed protein product [Paramecium primaurelia]
MFIQKFNVNFKSLNTLELQNVKFIGLFCYNINKSSS